MAIETRSALANLNNSLAAADQHQGQPPFLLPNTQRPMTNEDLTQGIRPLVEYIKIEIPIICDQHAETLANQLIAALPRLFAERPEIFSHALSTAGRMFKDACPRCGSTNTMSKPLCLFSLVCLKCGHDWLP